MHNVGIPNKKKSLSLFHINTSSLSKNSDDLQHLLDCTKNNFDIIGVTETRITKQVSLLNNLNLITIPMNLHQLKLLQVTLFFTLLIIVLI